VWPEALAPTGSTALTSCASMDPLMPRPYAYSQAGTAKPPQRKPKQLAPEPRPTPPGRQPASACPGVEGGVPRSFRQGLDGNIDDGSAHAGPWIRAPVRLSRDLPTPRRLPARRTPASFRWTRRPTVGAGRAD
jgi:hypothetical protein